MRRAISWIWPVLLLAAMILVLPWNDAGAAETGAKAAFKTFHTIVDVGFMAKHATIPKRKDVMIVDSRPKARKYDKGHIPTAISIPDRQFDKHVAMLPKDKKTTLVFYCGGFKCPLSHKSAFKAEKAGYTDVKVFAAGYPAWIKAGNIGAVSGAYVKKMIDTNAKMMIIDARPKARKFDKGHIPTAISIPWREFDKHVAALPADKKTLLVYYCGGFKCTLSPKSAMKAMELGYTNVKIYPAGYPEWVKMFGPGPKKTSDAAPPVAKMAVLEIKPGTEQGSINIASFKKVYADTPEHLYLVDVRDQPEFKAGTFKGSVNIPIDALEGKVAALPKDKTIVFFCNSGGIAGEAYDIAALLRDDLNAYFLNAEITHHGDGTYNLTPVVN
ncbi:MAG: rhodanese-like domain-containing protein [Rhodospirillaceae bacterium]|nr:rhodanese-like domain-containing protein [Rhodospirillaceae bacterium]